MASKAKTDESRCFWASTRAMGSLSSWEPSLDDAEVVDIKSTAMILDYLCIGKFDLFQHCRCHLINNLYFHFQFYQALYTKVQQGCLQFVILKPIIVTVTIILYAKGKYEDGNFNPRQSYLYLTIIYTISYSVALYALALFYVACRDLLKPFNPVPKFIIIKSVVFLTYWLTQINTRLL